MTGAAIQDMNSSVGWRAQLRLGFAAREGKTYLATRRHTGPLLVQRTFHPEGDPCHACIVHPPGGIVSGDELQLDVEVGEGAHALLTTPAATKFYRSDGRLAQQLQRLVAVRGTLEWLPQETIFFRDARVRSHTRVHLDAQSKFIGWEIPCFGLPARGETFDAGELGLDLELWCEGKPLLIDRMRLHGGAPARHAKWGLAGYEATGSLLAYPATQESVAIARGACVSESVSKMECAVTLVDDVLVCRALAAQAETIKNLFIGLWQALRPQLLGRTAVLPRIWAT